MDASCHSPLDHSATPLISAVVSPLTLIKKMRLTGMALILLFLPSCTRTQREKVGWINDSGSLGAAIQQCYILTGEIPSETQGLEALYERPADLADGKPWRQLIEKPRYTDAWGNRYRYKVLAATTPPGFEIRSLGPDGIRSGDDLVATFSAAVESSSAF